MATRTRNRSDNGEPLSLGLSVLRANDVSGSSRPLISNSFVTPHPTLPNADVMGDWYLQMAAVPSLRPGESCIVTKLLPGLNEHYRGLGLLTDDMEVIEVIPRSSNYQNPLGHASTDPLVISENGAFLRRDLTLVSTFVGSAIYGHGRRLGLNVLDRPDSAKTNNKAAIRREEVASKYGFNMLPGMLLYDHTDVNTAYEDFSGEPHGVWLKLALGSGGDFVTHLSEFSRQDIRAAGAKMRRIAGNYFAAEGFPNFDLFWPHHLFSPPGYPVILETDVQNVEGIAYSEPAIEGKKPVAKYINGSTQMLTNMDGSVDVKFYAEQVTTEAGIFIGSRPLEKKYRIGSELQQLLRKEAEKVGEYNIKENGYFGVQGIDWFLVYTNSGVKYYLTELNSRPTVTTLAVITADKLGCDHWLNTNVYTETPIYSIRDFISLMGGRLTMLNGSTVEEKISTDGLVVPLAFRTLTGENDSVLRPSNDFKILICGRDNDHCEEIKIELESTGKISFTELR